MLRPTAIKSPLRFAAPPDYGLDSLFRPFDESVAELDCSDLNHVTSVYYDVYRVLSFYLSFASIRINLNCVLTEVLLLKPPQPPCVPDW